MFLKCLWICSSQNSKLEYNFESLELKQGSWIVHFTVFAPTTLIKLYQIVFYY